MTATSAELIATIDDGLFHRRIGDRTRRDDDSTQARRILSPLVDGIATNSARIGTNDATRCTSAADAFTTAALILPHR
jgi:hypothetical protein